MNAREAVFKLKNIGRRLGIAALAVLLVSSGAAAEETKTETFKKCLDERIQEVLRPQEVEPESVTARKANEIAEQKNLKISFSEIGAGQAGAQHLENALGGPERMYVAMSPYARDASDRRYSVEKIGPDTLPYINERRLQSQLSTEYKRIAPSPMKAVVADTVRTERGGGHGWVGFQGQLAPGAAPTRVELHVRLRSNLSEGQKIVLGKLEINLLYASYHLTADPQAFIKSLFDDISKDDLQLDVIHIRGPGFPKLSNTELARILLDTGAAKYVVLDPGQRMISLESFVPDSSKLPSQATELQFEQVPPSTAETAPLLQPLRKDRRFWILGANSDYKQITDYLSDVLPKIYIPRRLFDRSRLSEAKDPTDMKARVINYSDRVRGEFVEIGQKMDIVTGIFSAPLSSTVYESAGIHSLAALRARYPEIKTRKWDELLSDKTIEDMLDKEFQNVTAIPNIRRFALVKQVVDTPQGRFGVIAIEGELVSGGPTLRKTIRFTIDGSSATSTLQDKQIRSLGINALYSFFHSDSDPARFLELLQDGIDPDIISDISVQ